MPATNQAPAQQPHKSTSTRGQGAKAGGGTLPAAAAAAAAAAARHGCTLLQQQDVFCLEIGVYQLGFLQESAASVDQGSRMHGDSARRARGIERARGNGIKHK
jgi:hypothetical protein